MSQPNVGKSAVPGTAVATGAGRPRAAAAEARRDAWLRRLPLLPALVYVFLITQVPFALTVYYSLFSWNLLRPGSFQFAGLRNYADVLGEPGTRIAILNTVVLTLFAVGISVVIGVFVAVLLNREIFGKGVL